MTTTAEKIARSGNTTDLSLSPNEVGAADVLIACGWSPTTLGRMLCQLQSEWDGCAKPLKMTLTDFILLASSLKSYLKVVNMVEQWAQTKQLLSPHKLAQMGVSYWVDNNCHTCFGRGYEQIAGTPKLGKACQACSGTGKRRLPLGDDGKKVLSMLEDCYARAIASVKRRLRNF